MNIDTNSIVTATEANQNFSRVARLAEKRGKVVIFKNNRPKLLLIDLDTEPQIEMSEDEKLEFVAGRIRIGRDGGFPRGRQVFKGESIAAAPDHG